MVCGPVQSDKAGLSYSTMAKSDWWFILSMFVCFPTRYVWDTDLKPQKFGMGYYFSPAMVIINRGQGPVIAGSPAGIGVGEGASGKSQLGSSEMW